MLLQGVAVWSPLENMGNSNSKAQRTFYDFALKDITGTHEIATNQFKGKVGKSILENFT